MEWNLMFFVNSAMLGVGLAMDAFSVSLANGLNEPQMKKGRMCKIAGVFAGFQAFMPFIGWVCVHTMLQYFKVFENFIPWIALILLCFIGGKMLNEGILNKGEEVEKAEVGFKALMVQGIATSIDALSVGFTIAIVILAGIREKMEYNDIPESFKGMPIVLLTAGLMAIAFCGFQGLL